jgi:hypothetical protein
VALRDQVVAVVFARDDDERGGHDLAALPGAYADVA